MIFLIKNPVFFWRGGGEIFYYKLTRNPNLTKNLFFLFLFFFFFSWGGGGGGGVGGGRSKGRGQGKCTCMNKCFKWHFYSSTVENHFEIHAYM